MSEFNHLYRQYQGYLVALTKHLGTLSLQENLLGEPTLNGQTMTVFGMCYQEIREVSNRLRELVILQGKTDGLQGVKMARYLALTPARVSMVLKEAQRSKDLGTYKRDLVERQKAAEFLGIPYQFDLS